jgi:hypothetical protein
VFPWGPYLNLRGEPVLPTRAMPVLTPMPRSSGSPRVGLPAVVELAEQAEHVEGGPASEAGVAGLFFRSAPHGQQLVADVIDQHAAPGDDALGQRPHDVADPGHRPGRAEALADPAEAADIAEEQGDLAVTPLQQVRVGGQLPGQFGREELLELDARGQGGAFLLQAGQSRRDAAREQLHEHRFHLGNRFRGRRAVLAAVAVERADDFPLPVQGFLPASLPESSGLIC